jgi:hypothetical protein
MSTENTKHDPGWRHAAAICIIVMVSTAFDVFISTAFDVNAVHSLGAQMHGYHQESASRLEKIESTYTNLDDRLDSIAQRLNNLKDATDKDRAKAEIIKNVQEEKGRP